MMVIWQWVRFDGRHRRLRRSPAGCLRSAGENEANHSQKNQSGGRDHTAISASRLLRQPRPCLRHEADTD